MTSKLLTRDEETELINAARLGDDKARQTLIEKNMGLCWKVALKAPRPRWMDAEDLAHEGIFGLDHAIDLFDTKRGVKFSTYAALWVRQAIQRKVEKTMYSLYTPTYIYDRIGRVKKARRQVVQQLGRDATVEEICEESGLTVGQVLEVLPLEQPASSLDEKTGTDQRTRVVDLVRDQTDYEGPVDQAIWLKQCLDVLPDRLREVITLRYGLDGTRAHTLQEVAKLKRRSREAIRKQEEKALTIIRAHVEGREDEVKELMHV